MFLANTRKRALPDANVFYQPSLIVGLLGTNVVPEIQDELHSGGNGGEPSGWDNQISEGGELTADYVVTRYETLALRERRGFGSYQVQGMVGASVGFGTQLGLGINARWGRYNSPWWDFVPDYSQFVNLEGPPSKVPQAGRGDLFFWGSLNLRLSLYNALLEGQLRDSAVTYDRDELRPVVGVASVGLTRSLGSGFQLTLALRGRTPELKASEARLPTWGSVMISRRY